MVRRKQSKIKTTEDVVFVLAKNAVRLEFGDIPPEVIAATKNALMDTLGVMLAASGTVQACRQVADFVLDMGGAKESRIINFGGKVPAPMAAFANGAMGHALDYDDIHWKKGERIHPSSTIIPAALSMADREKGINGKQFLTAVALGRDTIIRMARAVGGQGNWYIWQLTALFGTFAATVACCKILELDEDRIVDAMGIALSQAAGTMELRFAHGSDLGGMYSSFPAKAAVFSALMAQRGIKGLKTCLEGKAGLFNAYFGGQYHRKALTAALGKKIAGAKVSFKPWPACALSHVYIDGTIQMIQQHQISPDQIESVTVSGGKRCQTLCQPLAARRRPATILDAKYNIIFPVAVAIAKGGVAINDFSEDGITDARVLALADKVTFRYDSQLEDPGSVPPGKVEIKLKTGKTLKKRVNLPYGHSRKPIPKEKLVAKFRDCASHAARKISTKRIDSVVKMIDRLEEIKNVGEVIDRVTPD